MTAQEALEIARKAIKNLEEGDEYVILEDRTEERAFGWVFYYTTRKYFETRNPSFLKPGIGPVIVDRRDGAVTFVTTSVNPQQAIEAFENNWLQKK